MKQSFSLEGRETRQFLLKGLNQSCRAIRLSYGPSGCGVMMHRPPAPPELLRDGYSIARETTASHKICAQSSVLLKEALFDMNRDLGDGCSSLALIAEAVLGEANVICGHKISSGKLAEQISDAADCALAELDKIAVPYDPHLHRLALAKGASKNQNELAAQIAEVDTELKGKGRIVVKDMPKRGIQSDISDGISLPAGHADENFSPSPYGQTDVYIAPYVLLADLKILHFGKLVPILEGFSQSDKSLVILCRGIEGAALATLAVNIRESGLQATAIALPDVSFRALDILGDVQVISGGSVVSDSLGQNLEGLQPNMLGRLSRVEVNSGRTVLWGDPPDKARLKARLSEIRQEIRKNKYLSLDRERADLRLANLTGGVAEVHVGNFALNGHAQSRTVAERIARAFSNARESGVLQGAGVSYLQAAERCATLATPGGDILSRALKAPRLVIDGCSNDHFFRALRREYPSDQAFHEECLDCVSTVKEAISRAASLATTLMRTEVSITR